MNVCDIRHQPKYQITYKAARGRNYTQTTAGSYNPVWLVCESCMENKRHFGSDDQVESVEMMA